MKKIFTFLFLFVVSLSLFSCKNNEVSAIRVAINNKGESITYKGDSNYIGHDNVEYKNGDLKPVWKEVEKNLNIDITDASSDADEDTGPMFERLLGLSTPFDGVDIVNGLSANFIDNGPVGLIVPLSDHFDKLPNLKKFLDENPAIAKLLQASDGKIYHTPYLDSYGDITTTFMMRLDWVQKLLDTPIEQITENGTILEQHFEPTIVGDDFVALKNSQIKVPNLDSDGNLIKSNPTKIITKHYSDNQKNILEIQNELIQNGNGNGKELLIALRNHIDSVYQNQYAKRSDLFISSQATYDADELVALMRVIKTNSKFLTGSDDEITIFVPRSPKGTDHRLITRLSQIWGVRGVESGFQWTFLDSDGQLQDARDRDEMYVAFDRLHQLYQEGLIQEDYDEGFNGDKSLEWRKELLTRGKMFMSYDIPSTSSAFTTGDELTGVYESVLPPVVKWDDGDDTTNYFHFTESINNLKTGGWGIPTNAFNQSQEKIDNMFKLIDYFFTEEGSDLINFGPKAWQDGTFELGGKTYPKLSDKTISEIQDKNLKSAGNWSNYMRIYLGATLTVGHSRPSALAYQTLTEQGKEGAKRLSIAVEAGTYIIASFDKQDNPWYQAMPSTMPLSKEQTDNLNSHNTLAKKFEFSSKIIPMFTSLIKNGWDDPNVQANWGTKEQITTAREEFRTYWLETYRLVYNENFK